MRLKFNPKAHRYSISDREGKKFQCPSVTTILNVLNKPALVEWGVRCACDFMCDSLSELFAADSFSPEQILDLVNQARQAHNRVKKTAADIGTEAHDWLAGYWKGMSMPLPPEGEPVRHCIDAAMKWIKEHDAKPYLVERPCYSRRYMITGTPDFIGLVDGEVTVLDYKSTKKIWPEVALQMAPYASMYLEEHGVEVKNRIAIRMDKVTGEFESRTYGKDTFDPDMDTFLSAFKLYDRMKHLSHKPKKDWLEKIGG